MNDLFWSKVNLRRWISLIKRGLINNNRKLPKERRLLPANDTERTDRFLITQLDELLWIEKAKTPQEEQEKSEADEVSVGSKYRFLQRFVELLAVDAYLPAPIASSLLALMKMTGQSKSEVGEHRHLIASDTSQAHMNIADQRKDEVCEHLIASDTSQAHMNIADRRKDEVGEHLIASDTSDSDQSQACSFENLSALLTTIVYSITDDTDISLLMKNLHMLKLLLSKSSVSGSEQLNIQNVLRRCHKLARSDGSVQVVGAIERCLSLVGFPGHPKCDGINILSIDGGGLRGFVAIELLRKIEAMCRKPIYRCFDMFVGTSTGAVLIGMLVGLQYSVDKVEEIYRRFGKILFSRNAALGMSSLVTSMSYYDSALWADVLRAEAADIFMTDSGPASECPKMALVSAVTRLGRYRPFLMRNYRLPADCFNMVRGTSQLKLWEAVRASTAIPLYHEPFKFKHDLLFDGGLVANNPTALAIHEAKCMWPECKMNCVVSIGNGYFSPDDVAAMNSSAQPSIANTLTSMIDTISSTKPIHMALKDQLHSDTYFRLNPALLEEFSPKESRLEKWDLMGSCTTDYIHKNRVKFERLRTRLTRKISTIESTRRYIKDLSVFL